MAIHTSKTIRMIIAIIGCIIIALLTLLLVTYVHTSQENQPQGTFDPHNLNVDCRHPNGIVCD